VIAVARVPLDLLSFLPSIRSCTMLTPVYLRLLLTTFPTPAVYNNTTPFLEPQIHINPLEINENGLIIEVQTEK